MRKSEQTEERSTKPNWIESIIKD